MFNEMKVIVAGGRNFKYEEKHIYWLMVQLSELGATEVVSGDAPGADQLGIYVANEMKLPVKHFPADWVSFGKSAGPRRNKEMADHADVCILFPGGAGTMNMRLVAEANGLKVIIYKEE